MPKISGYDNLKYNKERAQSRLDQFCNSNANASQQEIERRMKEIVAEEAIIATLRHNYSVNHPEAGEDILQAQEKLYCEQFDASRSSNSVTWFINEYDGKYFNKAIADFQKKHWGSDLLKGKDDSTNIRAVYNEFVTLIGAFVERNTVNGLKNIGTQVHREMFARKVDNTNSAFVPNKVAHRSLVKSWQDDTAAVEINVPENLSDLVDDRMVEFLCFSELMKDKNLLKTRANLDLKGSTLPTTINTIETAKTSFFDNLVGAKDMRANIMATFSVMPEVRRNVNDMLATGNTDTIKNSLKSAFNELYVNTVISSIEGDRLIYSTTKINELMSMCREKNIDLGITKEQEENIRLANVKRDLVIKRAEYAAEISRLETERILSGGKDPEADYSKNPDLIRKLTEYAALDSIIRVSNNEHQALVKNKYSFYSNDHSRILQRKHTPIEQQLLNDPEKFVAVVGQKLTALDKNGTGLRIPGKIELEQFIRDAAFEVLASPTQAFDCEGFEKELAGDFLNDAKQWFEQYKTGEGYVNASKDAKDCITLNLQLISNLQQKRADNAGKPFTIDLAKDLAKEYDKLAESCNTYITRYGNKSRPHPENSSLSDYSILMFSTLGAYSDGIENYFKYTSRQEALKNAVAAYVPSETLFGVSAANLDSLKWGLTKGEHALHLFDAKNSLRKDIVEIDPANSPDPSTREAGQSEVYNNYSASLTHDKFMDIARTAAAMFEDPATDSKLKSILKDVKSYVTAENRAAQQAALVKMNKSISEYKKNPPSHGAMQALNLEKLVRLQQQVQEYTNGGLNPSPESLQGKPAEPKTTSIGGITRWTALEGELFPHDPSPTDIKQGKLNDCFALSCMIKIAQKNPEKIRQAMRDNNDGTVSVRFYNRYRNPETLQWVKEPVDIRVNKTVPKTLAGNAVYSSSSNWVQMMEKAYAVFMTEKYVDSAGRDKFAGNKNLKGYERLEHGDPKDFLDAFDPDPSHVYSGGKNNISFFTSGNAGRYDLNSPKPAEYNEAENEYFKVLSEANNGTPVMVGSNPDDKNRQSYCLDHGIRTQHAYAVMGTFEKEVNGKMQKFVTLRDPFATYSAKYDDKGNLVNNSDFLKGTRRAGTDNMGQFNLEYSDFLRTFDSLIGAPEDLVDRAEKIELAKNLELEENSKNVNVDNNIEIIGSNGFEVIDNKAEKNDFEVVENEAEKNDFEVVENKAEKNGFEVPDNNDFEIIGEAPKGKYQDLKEINNERERKGLDKMKAALESKELTKDAYNKVLQGLAESFAAYTMNQLIDKVGEYMPEKEMQSMVGDASYKKSVEDFFNYSNKLGSKMLKEMVKSAKEDGIGASYELLKSEMVASKGVDKKGKIKKGEEPVEEPEKETKVLSGF